jgi:hypothetical protein
MPTCPFSAIAAGSLEGRKGIAATTSKSRLIMEMAEILDFLGGVKRKETGREFSNISALLWSPNSKSKPVSIPDTD